MNRQRGVSSLALVLLLLVLGSLMLQGLNHMQRRQLAMVNDETRALRDTGRAHSALQWGRGHAWSAGPVVQCQAYREESRVCLRVLSREAILLMADSAGIQVWQSGAYLAGKRVFSPHGWSDFCPLSEKALCQMP